VALVTPAIAASSVTDIRELPRKAVKIRRCVSERSDIIQFAHLCAHFV